MKTRICIGTSGYSYKHWGAGVFYPEELRQNKWLEYYCQHLNSVELNVSFYRLPSLAAFQGWYRRTAKGFSFAVKGSRYITHVKRLQDPAASLKLFFSRTKPLKEKLAVVLWQLPPKFKANLKKLEQFIRRLHKWAPCPQVMEFRHPSWFCDDVYQILKAADIAICQADWPECSRQAPDIASFVYLRRHGTSGQLYGGCYSKKQLADDAAILAKVQGEKKFAFIYFNNDAHGWAIKNAIQLKSLISPYRQGH